MPKNLNKQLDDNKAYFEELELKKKTRTLALKTDLLNQMQKDNYKKLKARIEDKKLTL